MICVGKYSNQHDYEPLRNSEFVYRGNKLILAICRKCGKFV